jgi:hypothetical protein
MRRCPPHVQLASDPLAPVVARSEDGMWEGIWRTLLSQLDAHGKLE